MNQSIEVMGMMDGDEEHGFFAEGHHDPASFMQAAIEQGYWDESPNDSDNDRVQHWTVTKLEGEDGMPRYHRIKVGEGVSVTVFLY